ncbi:MAG: hypothetical protein KAR87_03355 [Candidatus Aenigmarchaeota archaeon]|nr:hypothetical protein [Candidatus Aenigmarchaeota archaeon]
MNSGENTCIKSTGEKIGFITGYFIFTTVLYYVLLFLNKLPATWTYINIMFITLIVVLTGVGLKRIL